MRVWLACAALALALALLLAGCSSSSSSSSSSSGGQPDPAACTTAEDCASGPFVDPDNVCCDTGIHLGVYSRKYLEWRARLLSSDECKPSSCPPQPSPALPPPCATQPRCVANRCTNTCGP